MLSPGWSQTIGFAGASEPLPNVVCPRRASRFGPSHKEYADDCRAGDVIRDPLRQAAEFAVVFRRDEPAHRASGVDAAPRVYGCRFLSSATRQSSHRADGAPPALVPGDCADEFAHQLAPISHSPRSIVDKAPRREAVRGPLHQYGARGRKAAGEQSLAGELSASQQRWRSPTGGAAPTGRSSRTSQPRPGRRQRAPSTRVGLCITGSGPTRH